MTPLLRRLFLQLGRWPIALAACFAIAALTLLPCLGSPGLWDPQERQLSDRVAPPSDLAEKQTPEPPEPPDGCWRTVPKDAVARSLTARAVEFGRDYLGDSDGGRKLPLALLGLFAVLAAAGTAMRTGSTRAAIVTTVVLLAMPLLALQSRMLTSDIGTPCGGALLVYGLVALAYPNRKLLALDLALSIVVTLAGLAIGFVGGGALLGLVVPIGAVAAAGSLGVPVIVGAIKKRPAVRSPQAIPKSAYIPALVATLVTAGLVALLAYQLYMIKEPYPGMTPPPAREMFGKAIIPDGCYSWALGAVWHPEDDTRYIFDSTFEQIAYGTFPWGILGPFAMFALLRSSDAKKRMIGAVTLAWAGGAWIAAEAFQRKSGFTLWPGFPALAIAIGVWLDDLIARRSRGDREAMPAGAMLVGLFVAIAVLDFGKDLQSFTEKLTSLLTGGDQVAYPKTANLVEWPFGGFAPIAGAAGTLCAVAGLALWQPIEGPLRQLRSIAMIAMTALAGTSTIVLALGASVRMWILLLGAIIALGFAVSMSVWRVGSDAHARGMRRFANVSMIVALAGTFAMAAFWTFGWHPRLAIHLSSKSLFETYNQLRDDDHPEPLVIMGDLGQAPKFYTDVKPEPAASRAEVVAALKRPSRVYAIAPQSELCPIHREMADLPYFVVDDRNLRSLLFTNKLVEDASDQNPLSEMIQHKEPKGIKQRPKGRVVWDNKIELLGWDIPTTVGRGEAFDVVTYYKIIAPVGGVWTMLVHIDGPSRLRDGDHKPIADRCPTSSWMPGDYIIDRHTMRTSGGSYPPGRYDVWIGFFTGTAPNFRNMTVSAAPGDMRDTVDRVKITSITLD